MDTTTRDGATHVRAIVHACDEWTPCDHCAGRIAELAAVLSYMDRVIVHAVPNVRRPLEQLRAQLSCHRHRVLP